MPIPLPLRFLITIFRQMVTIKSRRVRFITKIHLSINEYKPIIIAENLIFSKIKNIRTGNGGCIIKTRF